MPPLPSAASAQPVGALRRSGACILQAVAWRSRRTAGAGYNATAALGSVATALPAR
jgi:hypothetical protein